MKRANRYDARARMRRDVNDYGHLKTAFYATSGLLDHILTADSSTIRFGYDTTGRKTNMAWDSTHVDPGAHRHASTRTP